MLNVFFQCAVYLCLQQDATAACGNRLKCAKLNQEILQQTGFPCDCPSLLSPDLTADLLAGLLSTTQCNVLLICVGLHIKCRTCV